MEEKVTTVHQVFMYNMTHMYIYMYNHNYYAPTNNVHVVHGTCVEATTSLVIQCNEGLLCADI